MNPFSLSAAELEQRGARWTAQEIRQQPEVWLRVQTMVAQGSTALHGFLAPLLAHPELRIILTGAGTSAFIGQCLAPTLQHHLRRRVEAIATTDLVTGPELHLRDEVPTLLVSFARSGNSPESMAAIGLADQVMRHCSHLVITCSREGALFTEMQARADAHTLLLPEETNDRAFAMTSSFSGMLLAAALAFGLVPGSSAELGTLSEAAKGFIANAATVFGGLSGAGHERVVYLGSNGLTGLAREASLKLLELTDGQVVGWADSPLGFRHGPKTVINDKTLVVFFLSNDPYTRQYDLDLLRELRSEGRAAQVLALSAQADDLPEHGSNVVFALPAATPDLAMSLPFIVFAQMLALGQSLRIGMTPDNPSKSGTVTRVVHGVSIHPFNQEDGDVSGR